ncbi:hypothetical protein [Tahibacter soli]|uniref:Uncharacterized protein n=1 Tax=Tahibacter soli TaxID=2983605 RepID=A0A9X3YHE2_9GAMM|nr:hypothetical protein [Tahibacter soli]MDC8011689.1 hypothetical protein [Tahibacter soli]
MLTMDLRKGTAWASLMFGGPEAYSIRARNFRAVVREDAAVMSFELKPCSDNERSDARKLGRHKLTRVAIQSEQIARELARFRDHSLAQGVSRRLEIVHKDVRYKFRAEFDVGEYESVIHVQAA